MKQVTIKIPATSANLGPGFDCLGLALALYNYVTFTATEEMEPQSATLPPAGFHIAVEGLDADKVPTDATNLVAQTAILLFDKLGKRPSHLKIHQHNHIPVGSGLGSSSTAVLAGLLGANALVDGGLSKEEILQIAADLEGHPDNVAPALYGGLVLGTLTDACLHIEQLPIAPMQVAVILPDIHLLTKDARAALPNKISRADAIYNASHIGLLIPALATGDFSKLAVAMHDKLHQPYRIPLIPGMDAAFMAAKEAGASGVALSGAGPSLIAFAPQAHQAIVDAVTAVFVRHGLDSRAWVLPIDKTGCQISVQTKF